MADIGTFEEIFWLQSR